ncbi:hypothetical protein M948_19360 [Virgibacillus sp. CM-4]|uniref:hypothetical protein n=1 Tax=Virgibacillus sp. CM-4 TaxID=1354277 RepID=UPI000388412E|nr:hypothetical protein [Virgibacillus sp. CM-4]EQB35260.1 hypothetical protein M948_19360 [Virgibacillus sp. CM-4]
MSLKEIKKLQAHHAVEYSTDFPKSTYTGLERFANVADVTLKRAPFNSLEGVANTLILNAQHTEQERIKANPPVYDRAYVERADYSIMSLYSDYKEEIEADRATWADYQEERKKWRKCAHKFCLNMYPIDNANFKGKRAKRSDSRFCCETCKDAHHDAIKRYKETGSYLPRWYYMPALDDTVGDRTRRRDMPTETDSLEKEINKNRPIRYAPLKREKPPVYPVTTYYLSELTSEEIKSKKLEKYIDKLLNIRGGNPNNSRRVRTPAGSVLADNFCTIWHKKEGM